MRPSDFTEDELKVFLQEAESLLELLDESIVRLEQEGPAEDLIQEIFRAAHTLKGSSGMLGLTQMARLTHHMEDLLDRVRKGTLDVNEAVVDACLLSLDGLKVLTANLTAPEEQELDIEPIVEALQQAATSGAPVAQAEAQQPLALLVAADAAARERIAEAEGAGAPIAHAVVRLGQTDWAAVRCFQLLNEAARLGTVLYSVPSQSDVENERVSSVVEVLVAGVEPEALASALATIDDVESSVATRWDPAAVPEPVAPVSIEAARAQRAGESAPPATVAGAKLEGLQSTLRVDVQQIDDLMNLVGELVIDRTRMSQLGKLLDGRYRDDEYVRALTETTTHLEKVVSEIHEGMMRVRMLPVGLLFSKFPRLVRDLARSTGKSIRLEMEGEGTEIDRSVIEKIKDPLVHLIRNSCDHGIETPDGRAAAGKTEVSILRLTAAHDQGQIVISLTDDGRGVDAERVKAKAVERGVITAEKAARLSAQEAIELIFEPGLSTAAQTTEISGRGVGMDIVRRDIESLNGRVEVTSTPGQGTTFRLRLPLTLATFRGLLVGCGKTTYAIPLTYVQETLRPDPASLSTVGGRAVLNYRTRNTVMSVAWLDEALRAREEATRREKPYLVVVRSSENETDRPIAIAVDRLIDQQDIVVKSLGSYVGRARGIAGASILGDGQVVLILDIPSLIKAQQQQHDLAAAEATEAERRAS